MKARKPGNVVPMEARKPGNVETWFHGRPETWFHASITAPTFKVLLKVSAKIDAKAPRSPQEGRKGVFWYLGKGRP